MGYFVSLPIHQLVPKFGLNAFVETGTWLGAGVACARCFSALQEFHSIELSEEFYSQARKMFDFDSRVHLYCGNSGEVLPHVLARPTLHDRRILFWLDAHFPEVYGVSSGDQLPLRRELETIFRMRPRNDDLIIVDDWRIYEDGDYEHGRFPNPVQLNIEELVENRYNISKAVWQTGFLILSPRNGEDNG